MKKQAKRSAESPPAPGKPRAGRQSAGSQLWVFPALVLLVAGGTWAFFEFVVWNRIPSELVGKWVVTGGPQDGATFDFYRSGTMVGHLDHGGRLAIVNSAIRLEGDKLYSTTRHPQTGAEMTVVQTIRTLTPRSLVVADEKGNLLTMERTD